jgi:eukaryotic-like serine/threonine-protein kinase
VRWISDAALDRLRVAAELPDLSGTPYEIAGAIGRGGMGTVYLARDRDLDREVALKVVEPGELADRMVREARILARLEHPGIVPVHDVGTLPDGRAFYAMKRVRGRRLDEHARAADRAERLRVFGRVCEAVAFAHAHGVVHRDLKPENVMVGPFGEVLVLDWGAAKDLTPQPPLSLPPFPPGDGESSQGERRRASIETAHGTVMGTPGYMAPEQERGEVGAIDERTDVWALGAILAFLLEVEEEPVPRPLAAIRDHAMAAEPGDRYPGAEALAADLSRFSAGLAVSVYRESLAERTARFVRRYRTPILLILCYLLFRVLLLAILRR